MANDGNYMINSIDCKEYAPILFLCLLLIGFPLLWMSPEHINQDPYFYLSIANYYLHDPTPVIKDAFTVGPVIPIILAAIKFVMSHLVQWNPDYDVLLVKFLTLSCYVVIATFSYKIIRHESGKWASLLSILLILCLLPAKMDAFSLNAELVCVAMLAVLHSSLQSTRVSSIRLILLAVLSTVIICTKMQAIPLLCLIVVSEAPTRRDLLLLILCITGTALVAELILYVQGIGILRNLSKLVKYINPDQAISAMPRRQGTEGDLHRLRHLGWVLRMIFRYFAIYYLLIAVLVFRGKKIDKRLASNWIIWLSVTIFTIWLPGYEFEHYVIFAIPFIWKFSGPVCSGMENVSHEFVKKHYSMLVPVLVTMILILFKMQPYFFKYNQVVFRSTPSWVPTKFTMGAEMDEVRDLIKKSPGRVLVHGFDYSCYVYLNTYHSFVNDLSTLKFGVNDEADYTRTLQTNKFDYIVDIIDYSGIMREPRYSLSRHKAWGAIVDQSYDCVYNKGGLLLFRNKFLQPA
jgi:hypothetical protein